ncbi:MAG TPA: twin transmembrane helix small protein [Candidatus Thiothrix moscowensis]|uniref:twin transmembrane helix small protein n=1 Tax=unclassified Thiothrix TaxID=2636184 RepID=UPI001A21E50A|nr:MULTISPECIES: twin transmembrane helix small protein [unclassified Thiothrix]MBJ6609464.1 twin transmembrane helix small protein [Candidatus Thiothrix moscowensis]HRJ51391.1 twin transmembrane helix small protein [Candidatus Thiothrix moscowensis]HRJ91554.1 twin transmembrane helix small protein [Candidatus Thiothrix moscowensis]
MWFKVLIVINLLLILISLVSGVFFLAKDNGNSNRVVTSLTTRVALSVFLICLLIVGYLTGQIAPHGVAG